MLYEMMTEPPAPGTPLESVMLLVWRARQDIELQKTRAVVQAIMSAASDAVEEANKNFEKVWKDLLDEMYPFQKNSRHKGDTSAMAFLKREIAKGPLTVTPLQPVGRARSKLRERHERRKRR